MPYFDDALDTPMIINQVISYVIFWSLQAIAADLWRTVVCIIAQYAMCIT